MDHQDIDLDKLFEEDLPFKPLTNGLGFHHEPKKNSMDSGSLKARSKDLEKDFALRSASSKVSRKNERLRANPDMGDLAPFYKVEKEETLNIEISDISSFSPQLAPASASRRLLAFCIDLGVVAILLVLTFTAIVLVSGVSLELLTEKIEAFSLYATTTLPISVLFYLFYFSFFDSANFSTPGKRAVGIRLTTIGGLRPKMTQTFSRAFLTLVSVATLGLANYSNLVDKATSSLVVKKL